MTAPRKVLILVAALPGLLLLVSAGVVVSPNVGTSPTLQDNYTLSVSWTNLVNVPAGFADGSDDGAGGAAVPAGVIVMWSGTLATIPSGWALCDGSGGTPDLRDRFIKSVGAAEDPGATGGSATHTPTGTISTPTFTGSALGTHSHTYTDVPNHVHLLTAFPTATGGSDGFTRDTSMSGTPANNSLNTANPTGGVATGNTAAITAGTPAGTVSTPTFTGDSANTEPVFYKLAFIQKT